MKKFFSFAIAVMLALPMFAQDKVVEFTAADFEGKGTTNTGSEITVTKDDVTFTVDKGFGSSYSLRCYQGSTITIKATERIAGLTLEFDPSNGKPYDGGLSEIIAVGATEYASNPLASQARIKSIAITLGEGGVEEPVIEEITPEQALEIGNALGDNETSTVKYIVKGYVTYAKEYSTDFNNQDFYMASEASNDSKNNFYAYRTIIDAPGVKVGDLVTVEGKILKYVGDYGTTIEIKGGKAVIINESGIENTMAEAKAVKVIRDGQVVIVRGNMEYNVLGTTVK